MKRLFSLLLLLGSIYGLRAQRVLSDTAVKSKATSLVTGQAIDLAGYTGKKLLYVVMPEGTDTGLVNQVERFQKKYGDKVQVIAMVKPGTTQPAARSRMSKIMDKGMLVTEGIAARKQNSPERESVMEWISEKRRASLESELKEAGNKYFISEDGRLYGILGPDMSLDSPFMASIVNTTVAKAVYEEDPAAAGKAVTKDTITTKPNQHEK